MPHLYAIAIGSNRPHGRYGRPPQVVEAAIARLDQEFGLFDASPIILNAAHGGAGRDFANAVALVESDLDPPKCCGASKPSSAISAAAAAAAGGRACSISTSSCGAAASGARAALNIPHPQLAKRSFVLQPLAAIAPNWRVRGPLTVRHLAERLARRAPRG